MMKQQEYVIVHFLDRPPDGEFYRRHWYLHLTLLGVFYTDQELAKITSILATIAASTRPITVAKDKRALFGKFKDIPVTTIVPSVELQRTHDQLLASLKPFITLKSTQFEGSGYLPHVTDSENKKLSEDTIVVDTMSLVLLEQKTARVLATFSIRDKAT